MFKLAIRSVAAVTLSLATVSFAPVILTGASQAYACTKGLSCKQPTAKRGRIPVWEVSYCVVGNPGSYRKIDCKSPRAIHRAPTGNLAVCFVGSDGKVHWDYQREVYVGRPFINHKIGGRWQPDWQDARPY